MEPGREPSRELDGKVAVVTGAARGMGAHFAAALARAGCAVLVQDMAGAEAAAGRLRADGARAEWVEGDVSQPGDNARMAAHALDRFGRIDILINNAAVFTSLVPTPFEALDLAEWDRVMAVNVRGPFLATRAVAPSMRAGGGGRIVNIASTVAHNGLPQFLHYAASKGAVVTMTRTLARELALDGVLVNAVAPGYTLTDGVMDNPAQQAMFSPISVGRRAIKRDQVPGDLVGTVLFLCGPGAAFITGQTISVDGGGTML